MHVEQTDTGAEENSGAATPVVCVYCKRTINYVHIPAEANRPMFAVCPNCRLGGGRAVQLRRRRRR